MREIKAPTETIRGAFCFCIKKKRAADDCRPSDTRRIRESVAVLALEQVVDVLLHFSPQSLAFGWSWV